MKAPHSKYHPVQPCLRCGETKRIVAGGECSYCYHMGRTKREPGYTAKRRAYRNAYARKHRQRFTIDPVRAIRILTAAFEAYDVDIDDLCWWIEESRRLHAGGGSHSERRPTRHDMGKHKTCQA